MVDGFYHAFMHLAVWEAKANAERGEDKWGLIVTDIFSNDIIEINF